MSVDRILQLKLVTDVADIGKSIDGAVGKVEGLSTKLLGMAKVFAAAFVLDEGLTFIKDSIDAARDAEEAWAGVKQTLATLGIEDVTGELAAAAQTATDLGFSDEEALRQMNEFLVKTGSATTAIALLALTEDIARTKHIDLATAATDAAGIFDGQARKLREYGLEGVSGLEAVDEAFAKVGGAAEAYVSTSEGQLERLNQGWGDFQEMVGGPILTGLTTLQTVVLEDVIPALQKIWADVEPGLTALTEALGPRLEGVLTRLGELFEQLQPHIQNFLDLIQPLADVALETLRLAFDGIIAIMDTIIALLEGDFTAAWEAFKTFIGTIVEAFTNAFGGILTFLQGLAEPFLNLAGNIGEAIFTGIRDGVNKLAGMVKGVVNVIIDALNRINQFSWERQGFEVNTLFGNAFVGVGAGSIQLWPEIPRLAAGGIIKSPTLALVGESGPEAVVPLGQMGGSTYNVTVNVAAGAPSADVGRAVVAHIRAYERRDGSVWRAGTSGR